MLLVLLIKENRLFVVNAYTPTRLHAYTPTREPPQLAVQSQKYISIFSHITELAYDNDYRKGTPSLQRAKWGGRRPRRATMRHSFDKGSFKIFSNFRYLVN